MDAKQPYSDIETVAQMIATSFAFRARTRSACRALAESADGLHHRPLRSDAFERRIRAGAVGQFLDARDAFMSGIDAAWQKVLAKQARDRFVIEALRRDEAFEVATERDEGR